MLALINTPNGTAPVELREVEEPEPSANEAIVEVRAFSLNRGELTLLQSRPEGWRPGQDVAGIVAEEAANGTGPGAGQRVVGLVEGAGWAQRVAIPTGRLAALPDEVSFEAAAPLPIAGLTALRTLRFGGPLLGRRVLVTGASGGVGRFAVQLARRSGARVTGVAGDSERGEGLEGLGAEKVVTSTRDAGGPFGLILESVGGDSLAAAIDLIASHGTIVVFGNSSGEATPFDFSDFFGHEMVKLQTFHSYAASGEAGIGEDLALLAALIASGDLEPEVAAEASWRDLAGIVDALRDRRVNGKAVLRVD